MEREKKECKSSWADIKQNTENNKQTRTFLFCVWCNDDDDDFELLPGASLLAQQQHRAEKSSKKWIQFSLVHFFCVFFFGVSAWELRLLLWEWERKGKEDIFKRKNTWDNNIESISRQSLKLTFRRQMFACSTSLLCVLMLLLCWKEKQGRSSTSEEWMG